MGAYPRRQTSRQPHPVQWPEEAIPAWLDPRSRAYLVSRGITEEESRFYGLHFGLSGYWFNRILIPIFDQQGQLITFQGRIIDPEYRKPDRYRTSGPRVLYRPWDDLNRYPEAFRQILVIAEGPFDAIAINRVAPCVATLGNLPSRQQLQEIVHCFQHYPLTTGVVWYDAEALTEAAHVLLQLSPFITACMVEEQPKKDPGELDAPTIAAILGRTLHEGNT